MDLEVDELAGGFLLCEPMAESGKWYVVDGDVFPADAAARVFPDEVDGVEKVGHFRGHPGGGRGGDELDHLASAVASFL